MSLLERGLAALALVAWLLLTLSGSLGCAPVRNPLASHHIVADSSVTDEKLADANNAADELCEATGGQRCFDFARDPVPTENTFSVAPLNHKAGYIVWDDNHVEIQVEEGAGFPVALRHELGHAAGCWCHLADGNIMAVSVSGASQAPGQTWTDLDLQCMLGQWENASRCASAA